MSQFTKDTVVDALLMLVATLFEAASVIVFGYAIGAFQ